MLGFMRIGKKRRQVTVMNYVILLAIREVLHAGMRVMVKQYTCYDVFSAVNYWLIQNNLFEYSKPITLSAVAIGKIVRVIMRKKLI